MNQRDRHSLDRHITGNYGEDQMKGDEDFEILCEALEFCFVEMGKQGANSSTGHALRQAWIKAREALTKNGRL